MRLARERITLFHSPHYVLPPLTPCKSVVTIHDCIHLMFPQYLPNRLAYGYARTFMWWAAHGSGQILTVSEASKRDILRYFKISRAEDHRHPQRPRRSLPPDAAGSGRSIAYASASSCRTSSCCTPETSSRTRTSSA